MKILSDYLFMRELFILRSILLILVISGLTNKSLFSQTTSFAAGAGYVVSNMRYSGTDVGSGRLYYTLSAFKTNIALNRMLPGKFSVKAEPGFIQKGGVLSYEPDTGDEEVKLKCNMINLPVMLSYSLTERFSVAAGPEVSFLISAKAVYRDNPEDITEMYKRTEIGALINLSYLLTEKLGINLGYGHALSPISTYSVSDPVGEPLGKTNHYNQYLYLSLHFFVFNN